MSRVENRVDKKIGVAAAAESAEGGVTARLPPQQKVPSQAQTLAHPASRWSSLAFGAVATTPSTKGGLDLRHLQGLRPVQHHLLLPISTAPTTMSMAMGRATAMKKTTTTMTVPGTTRARRLMLLLVLLQTLVLVPPPPPLPLFLLLHCLLHHASRGQASGRSAPLRQPLLPSTKPPTASLRPSGARRGARSNSSSGRASGGRRSIQRRRAATPRSSQSRTKVQWAQVRKKCRIGCTASMQEGDS
mmetsp:Transcript_13005/g.28894  ORF Transcript_13005/g.28894 Transcript_13005/m.28894 type:complete len:245 (-) Transcript_13005:242-976(-)